MTNATLGQFCPARHRPHRTRLTDPPAAPSGTAEFRRRPEPRRAHVGASARRSACGRQPKDMTPPSATGRTPKRPKAWPKGYARWAGRLPRRGPHLRRGGRGPFVRDCRRAPGAGHRPGEQPRVERPAGPLTTADPEGMRQALEVNVVGCLLWARRATGDTTAGGAIVNVCSVAATLSSPGTYVHCAAGGKGRRGPPRRSGCPRRWRPAASGSTASPPAGTRPVSTLTRSGTPARGDRPHEHRRPARGDHRSPRPAALGRCLLHHQHGDEDRRRNVSRSGRPVPAAGEDQAPEGVTCGRQRDGPGWSAEPGSARGGQPSTGFRAGNICAAALSERNRFR